MSDIKERIQARIVFNSRKGIAYYDREVGDFVIEWEGRRRNPLLFARVVSDVLVHENSAVPMELPMDNFRLLARDLEDEEELIAYGLANYLNLLWWYARQRKVEVEVESDLFKIAHTPMEETTPEVVQS